MHAKPRTEAVPCHVLPLPFNDNNPVTRLIQADNGIIYTILQKCSSFDDSPLTISSYDGSIATLIRSSGRNIRS